jgi:cbb3-type cytochrome c oxidase subunit I
VNQRLVVNAKLVRWHLMVAIAWLLLPMLVGIVLSFKLVWGDFLASTPWLTYGRLRFFHTNGVIYGWLSTSFVGLMYYMVPRLTGRALISEKLAWVCFVVWNAAILVGQIGLLAGVSQAVEYAEWGPVADVLFALSFVGMGINVFGTIFKSDEKHLFVSLWYILLGVSFTALNFVMANTLVAYVVPGAANAALEGLWIHNAVGMWITPIGTAIIYYLLTIILKRPIYSHGLSMIGFWSLALFYPLTGAHHYFFSPIPMWTQVIASATSVVLFATVVTVVTNVFATLRGRWHWITSHLPLRFLLFGVFGYMLTCTQGPFQAILQVQPIVHFTDWVVAHAHMALLGAFTFITTAMIYEIWPQVTGRALRSRQLGEWHFWLTFVGFYLLYFLPDTAAGLMQGFMWRAGLPLIESIVAAKPFWLARAISGCVIFSGQILFVLNLTGTCPWSPDAEREPLPESGAARESAAAAALATTPARG